MAEIEGEERMKRFENLILCSDVDGTLIDENNTVPKENIEAIAYFQAHGGKFTLATGRVPEALFPVLSGIKLDFPCICHNGCSIYDVNKRCYIQTVELNKAAKTVAEEIMQRSPVSGVEIMTTDGLYVIKQTPATDFHLAFEKITAKYEDSFENVNVPWLKILFAQSEQETDVLNEMMQHSAWHDHYQILRTHRFYYEIFDKAAGKGQALIRMCQMYGIDMKNVAAIGDNDNDISMLQAAGISAATGNAPAGVKAHADVITCDNKHGAVADFIKKL